MAALLRSLRRSVTLLNTQTQLPISTELRLSTSVTDDIDKPKGPNDDYIVNPMFYNRNPRTLDFMGLSRKQSGWVLQAPYRNYYYKIIFARRNWNLDSYILHSSGNIVVSASTKEWPIKKFLYSCRDITAAKCIGTILALRCLEAGITHVFYDDMLHEKNSKKLQAFLTAVQQNNLILKEPTEKIFPIIPGIDYDSYHRIEDNKWSDDIQH
ncbi:39S ribosomal protein L18, mitochondrial [Octopus sinensis]|uniref:Large ribosomal subunit protein uL18m n=1 Tax=Octopus sinensis TaxID=2607531 RepID=A0A6P7SVJ9_9MOLL|nr:39S ribosomal protein L18, mitochondrial [Octopus sinensis]